VLIKWQKIVCRQDAIINKVSMKRKIYHLKEETKKTCTQNILSNDNISYVSSHQNGCKQVIYLSKSICLSCFQCLLFILGKKFNKFIFYRKNSLTNFCFYFWKLIKQINLFILMNQSSIDLLKRKSSLSNQIKI